MTGGQGVVSSSLATRTRKSPETEMVSGLSAFHFQFLNLNSGGILVESHFWSDLIFILKNETSTKMLIIPEQIRRSPPAFLVICESVFFCRLQKFKHEKNRNSSLSQIRQKWELHWKCAHALFRYSCFFYTQIKRNFLNLKISQNHANLRIGCWGADK